MENRPCRETARQQRQELTFGFDRRNSRSKQPSIELTWYQDNNRKLHRNQRATPFSIKILTQTLFVLIPWDNCNWLCIIKISLIYKKHPNRFSYLCKSATTNLELRSHESRHLRPPLQKITLEPSLSSECPVYAPSCRSDVGSLNLSQLS